MRTLTRRRLLASSGATALGLWRPLPARGAQAGIEPEYQFSGPIPQAVLFSYLSRTISMRGLWSWKQWTSGDAFKQYNDNLRMIRDIGAKHVTFVGDLWWDLTTPSYPVENVVRWVAGIVADLHAIDPQIIVGGSCFETIGPRASEVPVPSWVFDEFNLERESRNFQWERMKYADDRISDGNPSAPAIDVTRTEAQLWYYYWARRYIDAGCEHFDMGEIGTISQNDRPSFAVCFDLVRRIRSYAARTSRRRWILISGQGFPRDARALPAWTGTYGITDGSGNLLLDYFYAAAHPKENTRSPQDCILARFGGAIFGQTTGGISPSGWPCDRMPYTLNLDPGANPSPGKSVGWPFQWGWCDSGWFANQTSSYRAAWLRYANAWLATNDPYGFLAMSGQAGLGGALPGIDWYHANSPWYDGPASGLQWFTSFGEEAIIEELWSRNADPTLLNVDFTRPVLGDSRLEWVAPEVPSWTFGTPAAVYAPPTDEPLPSGQTATSMSGIARAGSEYAGSADLEPSQQVAFLLGTGLFSQALVFPGTKTYVLEFDACQRSASDGQEIQIWLDDALLWRQTPSPAWSSYKVLLGSPSGARVLRIAGSVSGVDVALIGRMRLVAGAA